MHNSDQRGQAPGHVAPPSMHAHQAGTAFPPQRLLPGPYPQPKPSPGTAVAAGVLGVLGAIAYLVLALLVFFLIVATPMAPPPGVVTYELCVAFASLVIGLALLLGSIMVFARRAAGRVVLITSCALSLLMIVVMTVLHAMRGDANEPAALFIVFNAMWMAILAIVTIVLASQRATALHLARTAPAQAPQPSPSGPQQHMDPRSGQAPLGLTAPAPTWSQPPLEKMQRHDPPLPPRQL